MPSTVNHESIKIIMREVPEWPLVYIPDKAYAGYQGVLCDKPTETTAIRPTPDVGIKNEGNTAEWYQSRQKCA